MEIERLRYGMEARERERTRWAREIHDEAIQGIGALRLKLASARDMDEPETLRGAVDAVLEGLGAEIDGLRHLITELRPAALDDLGLEAALQALARRAQAIDGLEVKTEIDLGEGGRLDAELESTIYRIAQEALTNVSRHAEASWAMVSVSAREGVVHVSVTDDGKGLPDASRLGPRGDGLEGGFGTSGMRERAELVGGELELLPAPGKGTMVRLTVPLSNRRSANGNPGAGPGQVELDRPLAVAEWPETPNRRTRAPTRARRVDAGGAHPRPRRTSPASSSPGGTQAASDQNESVPNGRSTATGGQLLAGVLDGDLAHGGELGGRERRARPLEHLLDTGGRLASRDLGGDVGEHHLIGGCGLKTGDGLGHAVVDPGDLKRRARVAAAAGPAGELVVEGERGGQRMAGGGHVLPHGILDLRRGGPIGELDGIEADVVGGGGDRRGIVEQIAAEVVDAQRAQQRALELRRVQPRGDDGGAGGQRGGHARTHPRLDRHPVLIREASEGGGETLGREPAAGIGVDRLAQDDHARLPLKVLAIQPLHAAKRGSAEYAQGQAGSLYSVIAISAMPP